MSATLPPASASCPRPSTSRSSTSSPGRAGTLDPAGTRRDCPGDPFPASPATVIDQAVAALTSTATTDGSSPPATPVNTVTLTGQPTNHGKRHKVSVKTKHSGRPVATRRRPTRSSLRSVTRGGKPALHTPNASLAVELSLACRETTRRFHRPFKP